MIRVRRIISGGQTGADRGALEAANVLGLDRGGWAPLGWRAEDGVIPEWHRKGMIENGSPSYRVRTRANVEASDGTLILSFGPLTHESGSMLTANLARHLGKPLLACIIQEVPVVLVDRVREWLGNKNIRTLNVAGPRESREPGIQLATRNVLVCILVDELGFGWGLER